MYRLLIMIGLAVLTGCQTLQTTKQPMPFVLSDPPKADKPTKTTKNNSPSDDEPIAFILEHWF